jgi:hypothetical protein
MAKIDVMPYLTWLEEVVGVAHGLDEPEKVQVIGVLRALARRIRKSKQPWREHVFALAIARFAFLAELPDRFVERRPICVAVEDGKIYAYVTDSKRATIPLEESSLLLMPMNLLGLVQTIESFRHEKWLTDEFLAAGLLADAQIHLVDEESRLAADILHLVARCLYGMMPAEPG